MNRAVTFYPASGYRYPTSGAFNVTGSAGYAWDSAVTGVNAYFLGVYPTLVYPMHSNSRAFGWSVRCVQHLLLLKIESEHSVTVRKLKV
jgi:hypothetical protein